LGNVYFKKLQISNKKEQNLSVKYFIIDWRSAKSKGNLIPLQHEN